MDPGCLTGCAGCTHREVVRPDFVQRFKGGDDAEERHPHAFQVDEGDLLVDRLACRSRRQRERGRAR